MRPGARRGPGPGTHPGSAAAAASARACLGRPSSAPPPPPRTHPRICPRPPHQSITAAAASAAPLPPSCPWRPSSSLPVHGSCGALELLVPARLADGRLHCRVAEQRVQEAPRLTQQQHRLQASNTTHTNPTPPPRSDAASSSSTGPPSLPPSVRPWYLQSCHVLRHGLECGLAVAASPGPLHHRLLGRKGHRHPGSQRIRPRKYQEAYGTSQPASKPQAGKQDALAPQEAGEGS